MAQHAAQPERVLEDFDQGTTLGRGGQSASSSNRPRMASGSEIWWRVICWLTTSWTFRFGVHDDEPVLSAAGPVSAVTAGACEVRFDALRAVDEVGL